MLPVDLAEIVARRLPYYMPISKEFDTGFERCRRHRFATARYSFLRTFRHCMLFLMHNKTYQNQDWIDAGAGLSLSLRRDACKDIDALHVNILAEDLDLFVIIFGSSNQKIINPAYIHDVIKDDANFHINDRNFGEVYDDASGWAPGHEVVLESLYTAIKNTW